MCDTRGTRLGRLTATAIALLCALTAGATISRGVYAAHQGQGVAESDEKGPVASGSYRMHLQFGGYPRSFIVYIPKGYVPMDQKPLPLVVMLHGGGGDGAGIERQSGWNPLADKEKFFVAYPDALPASPRHAASPHANPRFWNDASGRGTPLHASVDDVGFLGAILDDLERRFTVDSKRIYVTGFSSGASMAFHAASSPLANRIAAAAPVAGHFFDDSKTHGERLPPLLLIYGDKDPLDPLRGEMRTPGGATEGLPTVSDTVTRWAKYTGCPAEPVLISDKAGVKHYAYGPGKEGVEFLYWIVAGMGHRWPGGKGEELSESSLGPASSRMQGTQAIWKFFARHTLAIRSETP